MVGTKFNKDLDTAEIAKLIRSDIKAAQKAGTISAAVKVSVRTRRFAGGTAIDLHVTACPFMVQRIDFLKHEAAKARHFWTGDRHTEAAKRLESQLEEIAGAYRRDDSDSQSDYFNCNFYLSVGFDWQLTKAEREIAAELAQAA